MSSSNEGIEEGIMNHLLRQRAENVLLKYSVQRVTEKDGESDDLLEEGV